MNKVGIILILLFSLIYSDEVYNLNKRANSLYKMEKYAEALDLYEKALQVSPSDPNLYSNKGAALYKLQKAEESVDAYKAAIASDTTDKRSDLHYNLGNALNLHGDMLAQKRDQSAMDKYKEAKKSYIQSLDIDASNKNAKWNLQIINEKIKQMEQQQQDQQNNQDQDNKDQNQENKDQNNQDQNKDKKDQDKDQQNQEDQKDKENQEDQEKQDQNKDQEKENEEDKKDQENKEQQNKEGQEDQQPPPKPQPSEAKESEEEKMEKEEALRLLLQYADDDELNKPTKKMKARPKGKPEKDW